MGFVWNPTAVLMKRLMPLLLNESNRINSKLRFIKLRLSNKTSFRCDGQKMPRRCRQLGDVARAWWRRKWQPLVAVFALDEAILGHAIGFNDDQVILERMRCVNHYKCYCCPAGVLVIEIMAPQSSISMKKLNCWFESLDGATSDCLPKSWRNLFSIFKADSKVFKALF